MSEIKMHKYEHYRLESKCKKERMNRPWWLTEQSHPWLLPWAWGKQELSNQSDGLDLTAGSGEVGNPFCLSRSTIHTR